MFREVQIKITILYHLIYKNGYCQIDSLLLSIVKSMGESEPCRLLGTMFN